MQYVRSGKTYPVALALLLLGACGVPTPKTPPAKQDPPAEHTDTSMETESDEGGAMEDHVIEPESLTGAVLPERLLPSGMLEIGEREAPHTMLLVTEHHCGYCREFLTEHVPVLEEDYLKQGALRLSIAILPLKKYAGSADASTALFCAARQGKGWPMHLLLSSRTSSDRSSLLSYARELKIDEALFGACLTDPLTIEMQSTQQAWLRSLGIAEVPTYFIDGTRFTGLPYAADLEAQLMKSIFDNTEKGN